jgi:hypothetical protein
VPKEDSKSSMKDGGIHFGKHKCVKEESTVDYVLDGLIDRGF